MAPTRAIRSWALLSTVLLACGRKAPPTASARIGPLQVSDAFAYEPITPASGAAYFHIRNTGTEADTLLSATSPTTRGAVFHTANMGHQDALPIPPGGDLVLQPGGTHLMLSDFSPAPAAGDSLQLVLVFARAGHLTLWVPVRAYNQ
jgi:periplasmic copper chaperone A